MQVVLFTSWYTGRIATATTTSHPSSSSLRLLWPMATVSHGHGPSRPTFSSAEAAQGSKLDFHCSAPGPPIGMPSKLWDSRVESEIWQAPSQPVAHKPVMFQVRHCGGAFGILCLRRGGCGGAAGVSAGPQKWGWGLQRVHDMGLDALG